MAANDSILPVRLQSTDGTLRVEITMLGVSVRVQDHEFYFIARQHSISASGGFTLPGSTHDVDALAPVDCPECQKFILRKL